MKNSTENVKGLTLDLLFTLFLLILNILNYDMFSLVQPIIKFVITMFYVNACVIVLPSELPLHSTWKG